MAGFISEIKESIKYLYSVLECNRTKWLKFSNLPAQEKPTASFSTDQVYKHWIFRADINVAARKSVKMVNGGRRMVKSGQRVVGGANKRKRNFMLHYRCR